MQRAYAFSALLLRISQFVVVVVVRVVLAKDHFGRSAWLRSSRKGKDIFACIMSVQFFFVLKKFLHANWTWSLLEYYMFFFCVEQFSEQFGEEIGFFCEYYFDYSCWDFALRFVKAHWNNNNNNNNGGSCHCSRRFSCFAMWSFRVKLPSSKEQEEFRSKDVLRIWWAAATDRYPFLQQQLSDTEKWQQALQGNTVTKFRSCFGCVRKSCRHWPWYVIRCWFLLLNPAGRFF